MDFNTFTRIFRQIWNGDLEHARKIDVNIFENKQPLQQIQMNWEMISTVLYSVCVCNVHRSWHRRTPFFISAIVYDTPINIWQIKIYEKKNQWKAHSKNIQDKNKKRKNSTVYIHA